LITRLYIESSLLRVNSIRGAIKNLCVAWWLLCVFCDMIITHSFTKDSQSFTKNTKRQKKMNYLV